MKNTRNRTPKKDWQKADVRVLGQILAAQNIDFVLPDTTHIAEFFAETLISIPGISSCRVCLEEVTVQRGGENIRACEECLMSRKGHVKSNETQAFNPDFKCKLVDQPDIQVNAVASIHHHFGFFVFQIDNLEIFNIYSPFINNLANYVALSLENRQQRDLLQKARDELEHQVEERTQELVAANTRLHEENEIRRQTENALRLSERQIKQLIENSPVAMVISSGEEESIEFINHKFTELFGYTVEDIPDAAHWWLLAYPDEKYREEIKAQWNAKNEQATERKIPVEPMEAKITCKNGMRRHVEFRYSVIGQQHLITFVDLTERIQSEETLHRLNRELRAISNCNQTLLRATDEQALLKDICNIICNEAGYRMAWVGYAENDDAKTVRPIGWAGIEDGYLAAAKVTWADTERGRGPGGMAIRSGESVYFQDFATDPRVAPWRDSALQRGYRSIIALPLKNESSKTFGILSIYSTESNAFTPDEVRLLEELAGDLAFGIITLRTRAERERIEQGLRESEERFAAAFHASPNLIAITRLTDGIILEVNEGFSQLLGYSRAESIGKTTTELSIWANPADRVTFITTLKDLGQINDFETTLRCKDGTVVTVIDSARTIKLQGEACVLSVIYDITERKQTEESLRKSEANLKEAQRVGRLGSWEWDAVTDTIKWSEEYYHIYGFDPTQPPPGYAEHLKAYTPESAARLDEAVKNSIENGIPYEVDLELAPVDAPSRWITARCEIKRDTNGKIVGLRGTAQDITERKQHEIEREAIIAVSTALRQAKTRTEILNVILDQLNELFGTDGAMLATNSQNNEDVVIEMGRGPVGERFTGLHIPAGKGISRWVIENREPYLNNNALSDLRFFRPDLLGDSHCVASVPLITQEQIIGAFWIARKDEITENDVRLLSAIANLAANAIQRVTLFEQTERQLQHLISLHQIDITISSSFDLNITLNILLNNVITQLGVDAASILLLTPNQMLGYRAGTGFWTHNIEQSQIRMGDGQAGIAALERRVVSLPDLERAREKFSRSTLLADEKFVSHYVAPLLVKGQVKGVLEVFTRKYLDAAQEWLDFFETLATQAAIAIDGATLFNNLQDSNIELRLAYDATIEGWSRALDMRDRETEGHSERVTEMALQLASHMGINDADKVNIRRGALLHDIGKMGIPDSILLKPGQLTESEWEIMHQHPTYAYEMLAPISHLKQALDIPYCHHEKWDGTGYPRGLKGKQIPLSARIFAIADVFDALTSTRPYRLAWSKEAAYQYIRDQAGKHFDPDVVSAFLEMRRDL